MKNRSWKIAIIQAIVIIIISVAASFSLPLTNEWAMLVSVGLAVVGTAIIYYTKIGPELFSVLATIISLPAILEHSTVKWWGGEKIDWMKILYTTETGATGVEDIVSTTVLTLPLAIGLGLLLITGYLALSYLHSLQKNYQKLTAGQAEIDEVSEVTNRSLVPVAIALVASTVLAVVVAVLLWAVKPVVTDYLAEISWNIVIIGLTAILVLAGYIYWLGVRHRG